MDHTILLSLSWGKVFWSLKTSRYLFAWSVSALRTQTHWLQSRVDSGTCWCWEAFQPRRACAQIDPAQLHRSLLSITPRSDTTSHDSRLSCASSSLNLPRLHGSWQSINQTLRVSCSWTGTGHRMTYSQIAPIRFETPFHSFQQHCSAYRQAA